MLRRVCLGLLLALAVVALAAPASSQPIKYRVAREYVTLVIEPDATCMLIYNVTIRVEEGVIGRYVAIGMPNPDFEVVSAEEFDTGAVLEYEEVRDGESRVVMFVSSPIGPGEERTFLLTVVVRNLIFKDEMNPGNVGLQFIPSWFEDAPVDDLRLAIVLPPGVAEGEFRNTPDYDNLLEYDGRLALYWERRDLGPGDKFVVGVSFPEKYLEVSVPEPSGGGIDALFVAGVILSLGVLLLGVSSVVIRARRPVYESPLLMIEALGPRKGLYAPEAAWLIESEKKRPDYSKVLTMILYSLVKKGALEIVSLDPLKVKVTGGGRDLRYYERAFLQCVREDGTLDEDCLIKVIDVLDKGVAEKMRGYNRWETIEYYKKIVERAWKEVEEAGTPELKLKKAQENTEWLMLDPDFPTRIVVIMGRPAPYTPSPSDPWIRTLPPSERGAPTDIVKLADKVASTLERAAHGIVTDVEKFADKVARTIEGRTASRPRGSAFRAVSCVCVSCACVCACVSCACACASGGVG